MADEALRECRGRCRKTKPLSQFVRKGWKRGTICNECNNANTKDRDLVKRGTTREAYDLYCAKVTACEICGGKDWDRALAIDHDEPTKTFRGLLCRACNTGIGLLKEDPVVLRAALAYLAKHGKV